MNDAFNAGYRFKLSMYWGSKWKTYFGLYYAFTYEAAYIALKGYNFPISKNRGWCIEELSTREIEFAPRRWHEPPDEGFTEAFPQDGEDDFMEEPPPILLPPPPTEKQGELFPQEIFKSVWREKPPTKRRL